MNVLKAALVATLLVSNFAAASGMPQYGPPDFTKWARKNLSDAGIEDARVVETQYPFNFTFCESSSTSLWRYDVIRQDKLDSLSQGHITKPLTDGEHRVEVEADSEACKADSASSASTVTDDAAGRYVASEVECIQGGASVALRSREHGIEQLQFTPIRIYRGEGSQPGVITCSKFGYLLNGVLLSNSEVANFAMTTWREAGEISR